MQRDFIVGENKYVEIDITANDGEFFIITSAKYKLINWKNEEIENGTADIEGHKISVLLGSPTQTGTYKLIVYYDIPPETRAVRVDINVTE